MKIIRLWGVISFFALGAILTVVWYLVAPSVIANGIETAGSEALGAKVEVDNVELALFPVRIKINRLQAADPKQPMSNLFEADQISFAVDSEALLWKKILIEELTVDGIQLGTTRQSSGRLKEGRLTEQLSNSVASSVELPEMSEQSIKELVDKADLITVKRLDELNQNQQQLQAFWKSALDKDEFKKSTVEIENEFKRLSDRAKENRMSLLTDRKAWKKLKKKVDLQRKELKRLNKKLKTDKKNLQQQIVKVRQGPKDDLDAIMAKVGLGNGIAGLSDKFLGPQFTPWIEKTLELTEGMAATQGDGEESPVYSTSKGSLVQFKDQQIFPDVLIKKIKLSGKDNRWQLTGNGENIGYFPWLIGKASKLDVDINGDGRASFSFDSLWKNSKDMLTKINSNVSDWKIVDMKLMQTDQGDWLIKSGQLNSTLKGEITLDKINLKMSLKLSNPNISSPEKLTGWQKLLATSLNQQKNLMVEVIATGSLAKPTVRVKSSIEKLFSKAIGEKLKQKTNKLKGKFAAAISDKVGDLSLLDGIESKMDQWAEQLKLNDNVMKKLKTSI